MVEKILCIEFGKEGCDVCGSLKESIPKYVHNAGLDGKVEFVYYNMANPSDEAIRDALWYEIPIRDSSVPSLVVDNGREVWKKTVTYRDGKADLITAKDIVSVLNSVKEQDENSRV